MKQKIFAIGLIFSLLLTGCATSAAQNPAEPETPTTPNVETPPNLDLQAAADYKAVRRHLCAPWGGNDLIDGLFGTSMYSKTETTAAVDDNMGMDTSAADVSAGDRNSASSSADGGYTTTNVQVDGVDEGDVIKTDGTVIYRLSNEAVTLLRADGADTALLATISDPLGADAMASDLYLDGDRLLVLGSDARMVICPDVDGVARESGRDQTLVAVYDVSDPAAPKKVETYAQDGYLTNSRLQNGLLYLITSYNLYQYDEDLPQTYIPTVACGGKTEMLAAENIYLPPETEQSSYTVVGAIDTATGAPESTCAVLGWCDTVYMSRENLYLACSQYTQNTEDLGTEDVYTVQRVTSTASTDLTRIPLTLPLAPAATATVSGTLLNSYAMDEYAGNLRLVTTDDSYSYTEYYDEKHAWSNMRWEDDEAAQNSNNLFVLDANLQQIGALTDLAPGEQVYSVRFEGETGYFVTFRQIDPLFCVDLSDPTAPAVLSALKIPGFSQYLHRYGDGLLMGFGQAVTDNHSDGLKLSMFDTTDPTDVTELCATPLEDDYSTALYDYHAILVDPTRNVIGFPVDNGNCYTFYGYDADRGFFLRSRVKLGDDWGGWDTRALAIGSFYYVSDWNGMCVLDDAFVPVCSISFEK